MNPKKLTFFFAGGLIALILSCSKKEPTVLPHCSPSDDLICDPNTPYPINIPPHFPPPPDFPDNPITVEGVKLGKKLFYDPILSSSGVVSCNACHKQEFNFASPNNVLTDVEGIPVTRNVMPLVNLIYVTNYYGWDGRKSTLEDKIINSIENPNTVNGQATTIIPRLSSSQEYVDLYYDAFCEAPSMENTAKALAQFIRIIISGNAKVDKVVQGQASFTNEESYGWVLNPLDRDINNGLFGSECDHCHGHFSLQGVGNMLGTINTLKNNALDSFFNADAGYAYLSHTPTDSGLFRVPSLRNIVFSAPYMHDGRFATIDDVMQFYNSGLQFSTYVSLEMKNIHNGGLHLPPTELAAVKAFVLAYTDSSFITNPEYMP